MIVCVCNAIRESDVRDAARRGAKTPAQMHRALGLPPQCGKCAAFTRLMIDAEHERADERRAVA